MNNSLRDKKSDFFNQFQKVHFKKGETIIQPEEPLEYIYAIEKGYVKSYSLNDDGYELIMNIYEPGSFFPITETLARKVNTYFFEAVTNVIVYKAPTEKVHAFLQEDKEVLFDLVKRISIGLEGFMIRTQYLIRSNATQKITSSLVLLARRFGEKLKTNEVKIIIPQTNTDIANLSGVSRETASIELKKLKDENIITTKNKTTTILDLEKLKKLSTIYYEDQPLPYSF
jgi:CRP-like cAMP-binding protein